MLSITRQPLTTFNSALTVAWIARISVSVSAMSGVDDIEILEAVRVDGRRYPRILGKQPVEIAMQEECKKGDRESKTRLGNVGQGTLHSCRFRSAV